jgi:hypothetical protein
LEALRRLVGDCLSRFSVCRATSLCAMSLSGESFGSAVTASSRPAAVAPSRIEQNRDDQDESVQGILVAGADQRRVRLMKSTRVMRDSG